MAVSQNCPSTPHPREGLTEKTWGVKEKLDPNQRLLINKSREMEQQKGFVFLAEISLSVGFQESLHYHYLSLCRVLFSSVPQHILHLLIAVRLKYSWETGS